MFKGFILEYIWVDGYGELRSKTKIVPKTFGFNLKFNSYDNLNELSFEMIDCQVTTEHLIRFGAREISRTLFLEQLEKSLSTPTKRGKWEYKI